MITRTVALGLLAACMLAEVGRELCFKIAVGRSAPDFPGFAARLMRRPLVWGGILLWTFEALSWVAVLGGLPLGLAFPVMALSYALVPLAGALLLGERMNRSQVAGAALVAVGVGCIGWSGL